MKTRTLMISAAIAAVMNCAAVNAQLIDGGVTGGLGGTLSGGTRNVDVMTRGGLDGSFDTDLDTGSLRDRATPVTGRVSHTAHSTVGDVNDRTEKKVGEARGAANAATRAGIGAAAEAAGTVNQVGASAAAAGSTASEASIDGNEVASAGDVAGDIAGASGIAGAATASNELGVPPQIRKVDSLDVVDTNAASAGQIRGSTLRQSHESAAAVRDATSGVSVNGDAEGSASSHAAASKNGVSARPSASAQGSAGVSR